ncbi:hypothetical protein [Saccharopolyspora sp. 7B]|uniref:hypothetical protein n=1 Tax=Saccharopolyspora sp. 7B TaxID=2877240 RepID=UPI0035B34C3A
MASRWARAIAAGTSAALAGSQLCFTYGRGKVAASVAPRNGSSNTSVRVCCPAVTIIGVRLR